MPKVIRASQISQIKQIEKEASIGEYNFHPSRFEEKIANKKNSKREGRENSIIVLEISSIFKKIQMLIDKILWYI